MENFMFYAVILCFFLRQYGILVFFKYFIVLAPHLFPP